MIFFLILIIIASVAMALFILIQNPKGGGLAGNIAGFNSQFMGVKQTTDVLEKGTWTMAIVIALLSLSSAFFIAPGATEIKDTNIKPNTQQQQQLPGTTTPGSTTPAVPQP